MKRLGILAVGLVLLLSGCDVWYFTDLSRARRISHLDIPSDAEITLVDGPRSGGPRFNGRTEIRVELSAEAYARLSQEAVAKGYIPIDSTVDTLFLRYLEDRVGSEGLYFRDPPLNGPEKGFYTTVVLDPRTRRILIRHTI